MNFFTGKQLLRCSVHAQRASFEHVRAVNDPEHLLDVLFDNQHRQTIGSDALDEIKDLLHDAWRTKLTLRTDSDGTISARGFHGSYVVRRQLSSGSASGRSFELVNGKDAAALSILW